VNEGESKAAMKVQSATDPNAKIQAAAEFIKKYPKSTLRTKVVLHVAGEINKLPTPAEKIPLLENMLTTFKEPADADAIAPILLDAYIRSEPSRSDDALRAANSILARNPNDLTTLTQLAIMGVNEAKKGNAKFVQQSQQAGQKAIEVIEAGKKPDNMDDARWNEYQTKWLPQLYQSTALLAMMTGGSENARARLEKAVALNASDPFNYYLLGSLVNDEYQKLAEQHKTLSAGPLKDEVLKQAQAKIDEVIGYYARTVALSEGNPSYQKLHDQVLSDLKQYWSYRHAGSSDGLQQYINQYKKP
jgi:hypothetical protein